jgi:hypothetical protein
VQPWAAVVLYELGLSPCKILSTNRLCLKDSVLLHLVDRPGTSLGSAHSVVSQGIHDSDAECEPALLPQLPQRDFAWKESVTRVYANRDRRYSLSGIRMISTGLWLVITSTTLESSIDMESGHQ